MSNSNTHVKYFESKNDLYSAIFNIIKDGDHIFLSGDKNKRVPLWHTVTQGTLIKANPSKNKMFLDVIEQEKFTDVLKRVSVETTKLKRKAVKLSYQHGFRIDQERIYTNHKNLAKNYGLKIHNASYATINEQVSNTPEKDFLKEVQAGDYVMVWSRPDENQKDFLHYPVQGWLWSKDEEKMELEFIHPPRMDIQKFSCDPTKDKMMGFGFYRKLVYQLSSH